MTWGKKREIAGNFPKRRKIWEFYSIIFFFLKKKNCKVHFPFFKREKQNPFFFQLSTIYKIYLLNCISWREEGLIKKKFYLSLNLPVKFWEFSGKEIRKSAENLKMANS